MKMDSRLARGPNVIGATGGSGTRVVARIVRHGGMFIGTDLNSSEDAIGFGEYSDRWINTFMSCQDSNSPFAGKMVEDLRNLVEKHCSPVNKSGQPWGWKEPRSIYLLPFFHNQFPALRFLHVVRDGRDIAFSKNKNQLKKHGRVLLSLPERFMSTPVKAITLWSRINLRVADYGETRLGNRYLRIRFEDLCAQPVPTVERILALFGLAGDPAEIAKIEVASPSTIGRWQSQSPQTLAKVIRAGEVALSRFGYVE